MNERPRNLIVYALVMLSIPLSFYSQIVWLYDHHPIWHFPAIMQKLTILNKIIMGTSIFAAILALRGSLLLPVVQTFTVALVFWSNHLVGLHGFDFDTNQTLSASLAFLAIQSLILSPKTLLIWKNPALRWWLRPPRYLIHTQVICRKKGQELCLTTHDLSRSGTFLCSNEENRTKLNVNALEPDANIVDLQFGTFSCKGQIIRWAQARGSYPSGLGIRFVRLSLWQRFALQRLLRRQSGLQAP